MLNKDKVKAVSRSKLPQLTRKKLGKQVPRRGSRLIPPAAHLFLKVLGWRIVGSVPDVPKALYLALPHTSNIDALYSIPTLLALDLDMSLMGKKSLFKNPAMGKFLTWAGVIPIDRDDKGSVLQSTIDHFNASSKLHLGLAPEGTREFSEKLKTGFYYIAEGANVPIIPVALDYKTKEIRFMTPVEPTGDIDADMTKIIQQYKGVVPKHPKKMSKVLQDLNNE